MEYRKIITSDETIYLNDIGDGLSVVIKLSSSPPEIGIDYIEGGEWVSKEEYELICDKVLMFLISGEHPIIN